MNNNNNLKKNFAFNIFLWMLFFMLNNKIFIS